jgi:hypothetical protein
VDFDSKFEIADCNFNHNDLGKKQETVTGMTESGTNGFNEIFE